MTPDEHNPEGTDHAAQGHALAASKPTPPALPPEVRAAITLVALKQFEGGMRMGTVAELAKRNADEYCAALAAVLAPLLRERDDLRAEVLRLQGIASTNADQLAETVRERDQLRAQLADARQAVAAALADKERLDWLEGGGFDQRVARTFNIWQGGGMKFRAAIDAARQQEARHD